MCLLASFVAKVTGMGAEGVREIMGGRCSWWRRWDLWDLGDRGDSSSLSSIFGRMLKLAEVIKLLLFSIISLIGLSSSKLNMFADRLALLGLSSASTESCLNLSSNLSTDLFLSLSSSLWWPLKDSTLEPRLGKERLEECEPSFRMLKYLHQKKIETELQTCKS